MNLISLVEIQVFKWSCLWVFFVVNEVRIKSLRLISIMSMMYWNLKDEKTAIPLNCLNFRLFNLLLKEKVLYCSEQYHFQIILGTLWWSSVMYLWEEHGDLLEPVRSHCSIIMVTPVCQFGPRFWLWIKVCLSLSSACTSTTMFYIE